MIGIMTLKESIMWSTAQWIEHINYVNDPRNSVRETGLKADESKMELIWTYEHTISDDERDIPEVQALGDVDEVTATAAFPGRFEVCSLCHGKGSHVDPSIDAGGISEDDEFWEDDYDDEADVENGENPSRYARGDYDIPCNCCGGKRVELVIDRERCARDPKLVVLLAEYDEYQEEQDEYEAERRAERRMGC
jgi:hypothetical protein